MKKVFKFKLSDDSTTTAALLERAFQNVPVWGMPTLKVQGDRIEVAALDCGATRHEAAVAVLALFNAVTLNLYGAEQPMKAKLDLEDEVYLEPYEVENYIAGKLGSAGMSEISRTAPEYDEEKEGEDDDIV